MILIQTPAARILALDVPDSATSYKIINGRIKFNLAKLQVSWTSPLPPGQWKLLGRMADVTELMAKGIVEPFHNFEDAYKDYSLWGSSFFDTALESFHSLMTANNIQPTDLLLIEIK